MKLSRLACQIAIVTAGFSANGFGQEKPSSPLSIARITATMSDSDAERQRMEQAKWLVRVDVQFVSMPQERALQLVPALRSEDDQKVEGAVTEIRDMVRKSEAILHGWPEAI